MVENNDNTNNSNNNNNNVLDIFQQIELYKFDIEKNPPPFKIYVSSNVLVNIN